MVKQATIKLPAKSDVWRDEPLTGEQKAIREAGLRLWEDIQKQTAHLPEMTMEEIDAEIRATRAESRANAVTVA